MRAYQVISVVLLVILISVVDYGVPKDIYTTASAANNAPGYDMCYSKPRVVLVRSRYFELILNTNFQMPFRLELSIVFEAGHKHALEIPSDELSVINNDSELSLRLSLDGKVHSDESFWNLLIRDDEGITLTEKHINFQTAYFEFIGLHLSSDPENLDWKISVTDSITCHNKQARNDFEQSPDEEANLVLGCRKTKSFECPVRNRAKTFNSKEIQIYFLPKTMKPFDLEITLITYETFSPGQYKYIYNRTIVTSDELNVTSVTEWEALTISVKTYSKEYHELVITGSRLFKIRTIIIDSRDVDNTFHSITVDFSDRRSISWNSGKIADRCSPIEVNTEVISRTESSVHGSEKCAGNIHE